MSALVTQFLGGLGLFLLGMWLLTDGLKRAAGPALEHILGQWTRTRLRGLGAGILVTGLVQSSSAVTVATIGFVNAGLLSFGQAVWVIFGSNVGTTMTGWLVAMIGFKLKIEAFALPLVGIGMLLHLTGEGQRRGALGLALAGFGTLFVGIDVLRAAFAGLGTDLRLDAFAGLPVLGVLMPVLAGMLLTVLMQSSSAAMTVVLTATAGGVIPLSTAAAAVIGVNVGTTVTAVIAALAATPAARRTAGAHVAFNLLTGAVALLLLAPLLALVTWMTDVLELDPSPPTVLAAFHTAFNVLGVVLMWPLSARLEAWLLGRFRTAEEDEGRARHLDATVLGVPALAIDALLMEVQRLGGLSRRQLALALALPPDAEAQARTAAIHARLVTATNRFISQLHQHSMGEASGERLPQVLRLLRHYETLGRLALVVGAHPVPPALPRPLADAMSRFADDALRLVAGALHADGPAAPAAVLAEALAALRDDYAAHKSELLAAGAAGQLAVAAMDSLLERLRATRQAAEQAAEAAGVVAALAAPGMLAAPPADPAGVADTAAAMPAVPSPAAALPSSEERA